MEPTKGFFKPKSYAAIYKKANDNNPYNPNILPKLKKLRKLLNEAFWQRDDESLGIIISLLTGSNMIFIGPPGTGKSAMYDFLTKCITNDVDPDINMLFRTLYHQFIKPAEVFGPEDIDELLRNKRIVRQMENFLANAIFAFHDEIYKANDAIRNTLLTALNEKMFQLDGKWYDLPTMCHFACSNEIGKEPAFKDRFLQWFFVPYIKGRDERLAYLKAGKLPSPEQVINLSDIYVAQQKVKQVVITDVTYKCLLDIVDDLSNPDESSGKKGKCITISDRRMRQILPMVQAMAYLNDREETDPTDCAVLVSALWNDPSEIKTVEKIVKTRADGELQDILELVDVATATLKPIDMSNPIGAEQAAKEIEELLKRLQAIIPLKRNQEEHNKSVLIVNGLFLQATRLGIKEKESGQVRR